MLKRYKLTKKTKKKQNGYITVQGINQIKLLDFKWEH